MHEFTTADLTGLRGEEIAMTGPISRNRSLESLKETAGWPGADRNTVVALATALVAARADAEGNRYFRDLSGRNPADATVNALAGFFQVRAGDDVAGAITKLDKAATMDLGLPQYFRGLALAQLLPERGPSEAGLGRTDTERADEVIADLEFVLAVRDQLPVFLLRPAYQGLARAYLVLGKKEQAAEARQRSGLALAATNRQPMFTSFSVTARDGMRLSTPSSLSPAPDVHVAQSYDFADFAFIETSAGVVAIDAGTSPDRVSRFGRSWSAGPCSHQSPYSHACSSRPRRRDRGRAWPGHPGHRGFRVPCRGGAAAPLERPARLHRNRCLPRPRREAGPADQRADVSCRRRHRVRADSCQGWRDARRGRWWTCPPAGCCSSGT